MELALELGMTLTSLRREMPHRELIRWYAYRNKRMLPGRRMELMMAQLIRSFAGGTVADYLIGEEQPQEKVNDGASAISAMAGVGVRTLGKGRKKKGAR